MACSIDLFYCLNNNKIVSSDSIFQYLRKEEIERASRFLFTKDKILYMNSHAFLNRELSKRTKVNFENLNISTNQFDKPYVSGSSTFFNLSQSHNFWSIGFCEGVEIGIDIEWINEKKNFGDIIHYYFTAKEQTEVEEAKVPVSKFFEIWTRKEALLKALGVGISYPLNQIDVNNAQVEVKLSTNIEKVYLETIQVCDAFISVASFRPFKINPMEITSINYEDLFAE